MHQPGNSKRAPFWKIVRPVCGVLFLLLGAYLALGLLARDLEYGDCGNSRMSRNCSAIHMTAPLELGVATLHLGSLPFAFGCLAVKPEFFLRKRVVVATAAVLVAAHRTPVATMWLDR